MINYTEVKGSFAPRLEMKKGGEFEGILLAKRLKQGLKTKFGLKDTWFYDVVNTDGEPFGLIGSGNLDMKMVSIPDNTPIKLIYNGKVKAENGIRKGKALHNWTVYASVKAPRKGKK